MTTPLDLPYPPLVILASDGPIRWGELEEQIKDRLPNGVSICLVTKTGEENRGGYFFHIKQVGTAFVFRTFDRENVWTLRSGHECADFINHVSGRKYSEKMWNLSQSVNLRSDEEAAGEPGQAPQA